MTRISHRAEQSNTYDNVYVLLNMETNYRQESPILFIHNASAGRIFLLPGHSKQA